MMFLIHNLSSDFQAFVDYRIQRLIEALKVDDFGIELDEKASSRRSALSQTLNDSQRKKLDALDDATAMRADYHMMQAYQAGFCEGIKVTDRV